MTDSEQANAFYEDLWRVIDRYRLEFDLQVATAIGTLEIVKTELLLDEIDAHSED